ncbi:bactofilin family protein [Paenibacillus wulumuqiensis]|uniref:hypothetical protein n=1 Tax=Paenibacillus wulumuqiensis TaxID=1567107 RepID=UPI00061977CE|nr:hypothetical protein [Paenibacillus wulumuqiensis]
MASNTPNLGLLKKNPVTDGNDTFNIQTMLNDNWDKIDLAIGDIPSQIDELSETAVTYKPIPAGVTSVNGLVDIGIYFTPNMESLSNIPANPVAGANWLNTHALFNVFNITPPYAGPSFLRVIELYVTHGTTQYYFRRNTKISISGGTTTVTHGSWERMITSAGGTITGAMIVGSTLGVSGKLTASGGLDVAGAVTVSSTMSVGGKLTASGDLTVNGVITTPTLRGGVSAVLASETAASKRWTFHIADFNEGTLYISPSKTAQGADWDFDKNVALRSNDGKLSNNGRVILDEIDAVKQSGVKVKQDLTDALNAHGIASSTGDTFQTLTDRVRTVAYGRKYVDSVKAYPGVADRGWYQTGNYIGRLWDSDYRIHYGDLQIRLNNPITECLNSTRFDLSNACGAHLVLLDSAGRAAEIMPWVKWQPTGTVGSGNFGNAYVNKITFDRTIRKVIANVNKPSTTLSPTTLPAEDISLTLPNDFNIDGPITIRYESAGYTSGGGSWWFTSLGSIYM